MEATAATLERRVRVIPATRKPEELHRDHDGKMRVAAYCRVSTDSEEQLNSYEAQKTYYTQKIQDSPDWEMAGIYADEGISGTSLKKTDAGQQDDHRLQAGTHRPHHHQVPLPLCQKHGGLSGYGAAPESKRHWGVLREGKHQHPSRNPANFSSPCSAASPRRNPESLSKNVAWGKQKSAEAGKVTFQYKRCWDTGRGRTDKPEIVPEEAEIIRRIYHRYLDGCTLGQIKRELDEDGVPTAQGVERWSPSIIHNILTNEKYIGDALLQKTYVTDCINKRSKRTVANARCTMWREQPSGHCLKGICSIRCSRR